MLIHMSFEISLKYFLEVERRKGPVVQISLETNYK